MELDTTIDFAAMEDPDLVKFGFKTGGVVFYDLLNAGALNSDSLFMRVGEQLEDDTYADLGSTNFGLDWQRFTVNVDPHAGKIDTVCRYEMDSAAAYHRYGDIIPEGPRRWTGGVIHVARVQLKNGDWLTRIFVGAASGVQGSFDQLIIAAILRAIGGAWELREKARDAAKQAA